MTKDEARKELECRIRLLVPPLDRFSSVTLSDARAIGPAIDAFERACVAEAVGSAIACLDLGLHTGFGNAAAAGAVELLRAARDGK